MFLFLVLQIHSGKEHDDVGWVLQRRIRLGHLFSTRAASSPDWAHVVVIGESQFRSHHLDLSGYPTFCSLAHLDGAPLEADVVCSARRLSRCLRDNDSGELRDIEVWQSYFPGSDHAGGFAFHPLHRTFHQDGFAK